MTIDLEAIKEQYAKLKAEYKESAHPYEASVFKKYAVEVAPDLIAEVEWLAEELRQSREREVFLNKELERLVDEAIVKDEALKQAEWGHSVSPVHPDIKSYRACPICLGIKPSEADKGSEGYQIGHTATCYYTQNALSRDGAGEGGRGIMSKDIMDTKPSDISSDKRTVTLSYDDAMFIREQLKNYKDLASKTYSPKKMIVVDGALATIRNAIALQPANAVADAPVVDKDARIRELETHLQKWIILGKQVQEHLSKDTQVEQLANMIMAAQRFQAGGTK